MTFIITEKDIAIFDDIAQKRLIEELYLYCESTFPTWVAKMGTEKAIFAIEQGIKNAKQLDLEERGSLYLHINLNILFGAFYYKDNQYKCFTHEFYENQHWVETERIKLLHLSVVNYTQLVTQEDDYRLKNAIHALSLINELYLDNSNFSTAMLTILTTLYPQKINVVGKTEYLHFIDRNRKQAVNDWLLHQPEHQAIFILMTFFLGQDFTQNPFLAWLDWREKLKEIKMNTFNFKRLSQQLLDMWELKEVQYNA